MQLTNKDLIEFLRAISGLKSKKMPMAISRAVIVTYKSLQNNYGIYEEQLKKLFEDCGDRSEDGKIITSENGLPIIKKESVDFFNSSLNELLSLKIDVAIGSFDSSILDCWDEQKYDALTPTELDILLNLAS